MAPDRLQTEHMNEQARESLDKLQEYCSGRTECNGCIFENVVYSRKKIKNTLCKLYPFYEYLVQFAEELEFEEENQ